MSAIPTTPSDRYDSILIVILTICCCCCEWPTKYVFVFIVFQMSSLKRYGKRASSPPPPSPPTASPPSPSSPPASPLQEVLPDVNDLAIPLSMCGEVTAALEDITLPKDDVPPPDELDLPEELELDVISELPDSQSSFFTMFKTLAIAFNDPDNKAFDGNVALVNTCSPPYSEKVCSLVHTHLLIHSNIMHSTFEYYAFVDCFFYSPPIELIDHRSYAHCLILVPHCTIVSFINLLLTALLM